MSLYNRFYNSLLNSGCIPVGGRVLVAVSGGADSVALLTLLHHVAGPMSLSLEVAHLDHGLRETSGADAEFVERLCADLQVPLISERQDVAEVARRCKGNLEEVARDVRRDFLLKAAQARACDLVALGHHADDQAETFLMRLLRGSGPAGLAGMRLVNESVVRPLLPFSHAEIVSFLRSEGVAWREDQSNLDQAFTRNRIRHQLLPVLESFNPKIRQQLAGLCEQMRQDDDFWGGQVAQALTQCGVVEGGCYTLKRERLAELAPALASRVIRASLQQVRGDLRGITAVHVAEVLKLLRSDQPQGELDLPAAWVARRYENLLICTQKPAPVEPLSMVLNGPGNYLLPDGRTIRLTLEERPLGEITKAVEFAGASLSFPLQLRSCQQGDRFRPLGMSGTKKLQDLFVDLKLTKEERQKALLLVKDGEVLWVVGLRRAEGLLPDRDESVVRVAIEP